MIKLENISFSYGEKRIFDGLNACFDKGSFCCIVGPNGSGKTTLLELTAGFIKPKCGTITVDGHDIFSITRRELAKLISVMPQEREKHSISVYDHISSGRYPYLGFLRKQTMQDKRYIQLAAEHTNLSGMFDKDVSLLSGGERQRVYLATVLAQNTPYVLLDEPTTYLDISTRFEVISLIKTLADCGKGVIAVMHDISLAMKYADKLLIIDSNHKLHGIYTPKQAYDLGLIERVFDVKCTMTNIDGKTEYILSQI